MRRIKSSMLYKATGGKSVKISFQSDKKSGAEPAPPDNIKTTVPVLQALLVAVHTDQDQDRNQ
ncbi:MAG: hypothetical protein IMF14_08675, partial [Proteobacteria bacterium]|nr:hypothetical protein [Pseudomonadota bacterium]